jgi:hypothetical protein
MTMYGLADVDFSKGLGVVVNELAPEMDREDPHPGAKPKATRGNSSMISSADKDLEMAVFGAP